MQKQRNNYTSEEKVLILKKHLADKESAADLCDKYNLQPTVFYRWQKEFFENGYASFEQKKSRKNNSKDRRIKQLEEKLSTKNEVLSELMEEHIKLKKSLGEL